MAQVFQYNALFIGDECAVPPYRSAWVEDATEAEVRAFLSERGMPLADTPADHIGTLLLAASWLERNQSTEDESEALETLFSEYLFRVWCVPRQSGGPCNHAFLAHHGTANP